MKEDKREKVDILEEDRKNDIIHQDTTKKYDEPGNEPQVTPGEKNEDKGHDRKK